VKIGAQFSVYSFGERKLSQSIEAVVDELKRDGFSPRVGPIASYIEGEEERVFDGLKRAYRALSASEEVVIVLTISNVAPRVKDQFGT
jgi:uncharacterized protein YqgV (UPF0045/DUF77 family)